MIFRDSSSRLIHKDARNQEKSHYYESQHDKSTLRQDSKEWILCRVVCLGILVDHTSLFVQRRTDETPAFHRGCLRSSAPAQTTDRPVEQSK